MRIQVISHRGSRGYEPENTLISLKKGIALGCDFVEFDVRLTKDNEIILMHDSNLKRTTGINLKVKSATLNDLKKTDVPTLEEVFKQFKGKTKFIVEIKELKATKKTIEIIKKHKVESDCIIISFKPKVLIESKKLFPELKTSYIWDITSRFRHNSYAKNKFKFAKEIGCESIYPSSMNITKRFMQKARKYGLKVYTYLGNDPKKIKKLIKLGVDMIESDYPDRVIRELNRK